MNKKNILFPIFLSIFGALILPNTVFAAVCAGTWTITSIVCNIGNVIGTIAVTLVVIFWIITGLLFMTAQGDPSKLTTAKKALIGAIIGTAVAFLAATATTIVSTAITSGF